MAGGQSIISARKFIMMVMYTLPMVYFAIQPTSIIPTYILFVEVGSICGRAIVT